MTVLELRRPRPSLRPLLALAAGGALVVAGVVVAQPLLRPTVAGSSADYPFYGSWAELDAHTDVVVRGTLTSAQATDVHGYPETVGTFAATHVAKGEVTRAPLQVAYVTPGASPEAADLVVGREYVLLLDEIDGRLVLVSDTQGDYAVDDGRAVPDEANPVALPAPVLAALGLTA
ncbi:hypothetical protein [Cellulomonas massiliensis]|uniref:hypothetical protein n=1 Tax=Cellulomonas massiliensis TaxID=1465811 RepID=UPI0002F90626|nr:hypothetical protein [Cellulomonas massiliensis]